MTQKPIKVITEETLKAEYERLSLIENIYNEKVFNWKDFYSFYKKYFPPLFLVIYFALIIFLSSYPKISSDTVIGILLTIYFIAFVSLFILGRAAKSKIGKIEADIGLKSNESAFILSYEIKNNLEHLEKEEPKRQEFFRQKAYSIAVQLSKLMDKWDYGNVEIIIDTYGKRIEYLREKFQQKFLPKILDSQNVELNKLSFFMFNLSGYFLQPTLEKIELLNGYLLTNFNQGNVEKNALTSKQKISVFFKTNPKISRLLFALSVSTTVVVILLFSQLALGIALGVGVTCFWGAFSGFDKLFGAKQKE